MLSFLTVLLLGLSFHESVQQRTIECSMSGSPSFIVDGLTYLQSPNFPQAMNGGQQQSCNAQLKAQNLNNNIMVSFINGAATTLDLLDDKGHSFYGPWNFYSSNLDILTYSPPTNSVSVQAYYNISRQPWSAFQSVVIPFDPSTENTTCPLASQVFDLSANPNLIIPAAASFYRYGIGDKSCKWTFKTSNSQKLKVVVKQANFATDSPLTLTADGGAPYSFAQIDNDPQVFFFDGSSFDLNFVNKGGNSFSYRFFLLVTAVEKTNTFTTDGCQTQQGNGQQTIFTNADLSKGYPPNQRCQYSISVPSNSQALLSVNQHDYEVDSDFITLTYGNSQTLKFDHNIGTESYSLPSSIGKAQFSFTSDGSIQGAGFNATLQTYECKCGNPTFTVGCDTTLAVTPLDNNKYYCDNMACQYQLKSSCPGAYYYLDPSFNLRDSDYALLKQNGKLVKNITSDNRYNEFGFFYLKDNTFSIEFHSGSTTGDLITDQYSKNWNFQLEPIYPKFTKIVLDESLPSYVFWLADLSNNSVVSVCSKIGTLEMFMSQQWSENELDVYKLFDDEELNNYVGSLKAALNSSSWLPAPRFRKSSSGCFSLYVSDRNYLSLNHTILFKTVDDSVKNCINDSVFQFPDPEHSVYDYITIDSSNSGACRATILSHVTAMEDQDYLPYIWFQNINTTSTNQFTFYSTANNKALFQISANDLPKWRNFGLYANAIDVVVPPSTTLIIQFARKNTPFQPDSSTPIQKGVMASPSYTGLMRKVDASKLYSGYSSGFFHANFNVLYSYGNLQAILYTTGTNYTLTQGTNITSYTSSYYLYYSETDPSKNGFLLEYTFQ